MKLVLIDTTNDRVFWTHDLDFMHEECDEIPDEDLEYEIERAAEDAASAADSAGEPFPEYRVEVR